MNGTAALKTRDPFAGYTADILLALAAPGLAAVLIYGGAAAVLLLACAASALLFTFVCRAMAHSREKDSSYASALATGLTLALLLPAGFPWWKAVLGVAFAIFVIQLPFGGSRHTPFSPAAGAFVFLCLCFPRELFTYALPQAFSSFSAGVPAASSASLASMLRLGESVTPNWLTYLNIIIGNVPSAIGTSCMAVLAGVSLYLLIRRPESWVVSASFVTVAAAAAVLFPRVLTGRKASLFMEISAGSLVLVALVVLPHVSCCPKTPWKRLLFGGLTGVLCMLLRRFGAFEEGACAAVLLTNAVWPALEHTFQRKGKKPPEVTADACS